MSFHRDCLKESKVSPGRRGPGERSFHIRGPAVEKLLCYCLGLRLSLLGLELRVRDLGLWVRFCVRGKGLVIVDRVSVVVGVYGYG